MRRVAIRVGIGLMCLVMIGAAALVIVRVANYDGRSPMEKLEDETAREKPESVSLVSCPKLLPQERSLPDRNRRQREAVVPSGAVELLLCSYYGFGTDTPRSYERQETLAREGGMEGRPVVPEIVREFQASERLSGSGSVTCPADTGKRLLAIFGYRNEPPVPVEVNLSGCPYAGARGRPEVALSSRLLYRLEHSFSETLGSELPSESD